MLILTNMGPWPDEFRATQPSLAARTFPKTNWCNPTEICVSGKLIDGERSKNPIIIKKIGD
jgi:hypothetical protein